jgi:hypothetical protein
MTGPSTFYFNFKLYGHTQLACTVSGFNKTCITPFILFFSVQIRQDARQEKECTALYFGGLAKNPPPGEKPDSKRRMTIKEGCIRRRHSKGEGENT